LRTILPGYTDTEVLRTGLSLGGTVAYVDERPANVDNSVTDEEIFSPGSFDGVIREEGRTYLARVKYLF